MKERLLQFLACPACGGTLALREISERQEAEMLTGELHCDGCRGSFPIVRGIPRFANLAELDAEKAATAEGFSFEWQHFTQRDDKYGDQFLGWLDPVKPEFFKNKVVLDAGCGKGRHTLLAQQWGARDVVAVDLSDAVETAFAAARQFENIHVVQADVCRLPFARVFDYSFSVGVLDHLPVPAEGFNSVASKIKPGGHFSAWVYGAENNGWITGLVNPIRRRFTSKISPRSLLQLTKLPTALLYLVTKLIYGPAKKIGGQDFVRRLYYGQYLSSLADFGWREQHTIVFDHLVAPTAHYVSRAQFEQWWRGIGINDAVIGWHNENSWRGFGRLTESGQQSMATKVNTITPLLPREMMEHTYPLLYQLEETHWWYLGRRRIIASFVKDICAQITDRRPHILDVGCGTGANLKTLSDFGDAEGVDVSPDAIQFCRARGLTTVKLGAAEDLPYESGTFDLVTALDVVEHLDDDVGGLREMRRVLRPGGHALIFVPTFMWLWGVQDVVSNHRRRYTLPELRRAMEEAGFAVERATYANITFLPPVFLIRLLMRITGIKTDTEARINIPVFNPLFARILGAEARFLRLMNFPVGVSGLCVARAK